MCSFRHGLLSLVIVYALNGLAAATGRDVLTTEECPYTAHCHGREPPLDQSMQLIRQPLLASSSMGNFDEQHTTDSVGQLHDDQGTYLMQQRMLASHIRGDFDEQPGVGSVATEPAHRVLLRPGGGAAASDVPDAQSAETTEGPGLNTGLRSGWQGLGSVAAWGGAPAPSQAGGTTTLGGPAHVDSNESSPTSQRADVGEGVPGQPHAPLSGLILLATSALGSISVLALISIVALGCLCLLTMCSAPASVWDWDQRGDHFLPMDGHKSRSKPPSTQVDAIEQQRRHVRSVDILPQSPLPSASHIGPRDSGAEDTLCADLTVPVQCECTLLIPVFAPQSGSLPVMTVTGNKLFDLKVPLDFKADARGHPPGIGKSPLHHGQREVWLLSSEGEVIARCMATARSPNNVGEYRIHDKNDLYFASVYRASGQYVLNSPSISSKCFIFGQCSQMALNVVKAGGQLLAATEVVFMDFAPGVEFIRLRVTSGGDVGLVLCALTCLQDLQAIDPLI